jgi:hypothetical protein
MTPREKALELTDMYLQCIVFTIKQEIKVSVINAAKQCALIAVDEIINSWDIDLYKDCGSSFYWQEVKKEINKK